MYTRDVLMNNNPWAFFLPYLISIAPTLLQFFPHHFHTEIFTLHTLPYPHPSWLSSPAVWVSLTFCLCLAWATAFSTLSCNLPLLSFVHVHTQLASSSPLVPTCWVLFCTSWLSLILHHLTPLLSPWPSHFLFSSPCFFTSEPSPSHWAVFCPPLNCAFFISSNPSSLLDTGRITVQAVHDTGSDK